LRDYAAGNKDLFPLAGAKPVPEWYSLLSNDVVAQLVDDIAGDIKKVVCSGGVLTATELSQVAA
jgi:hypothetical protein